MIIFLDTLSCYPDLKLNFCILDVHKKMMGLEHINGNKNIIFVQGFILQLSGIKQAKMQAVNQKLNISKMM